MKMTYNSAFRHSPLYVTHLCLLLPKLDPKNSPNIYVLFLRVSFLSFDLFLNRYLFTFFHHYSSPHTLLYLHPLPLLPVPITKLLSVSTSSFLFYWLDVVMAHFARCAQAIPQPLHQSTWLSFSAQLFSCLCPKAHPAAA